MINTRNKAFTLIELLVVIAIIGILSSVVLASLSGARESARDTKRQQDINQIRTAIEMYINDNGEPPLVNSSESHSYGTYWGNWSVLATELKDYIDPLPKDPLADEGTAAFTYFYRAHGSNTHKNDCDFDVSQGDSYYLLFGTENTELDMPYHDSYGDSKGRYCIIE